MRIRMAWATFVSVTLGVSILARYSQAEGIRGLLDRVVMSGDGRWVVATQTGGNILIWDMERLGGYLQPSLVDFFHSRTPLSRAALSRDGAWLAHTCCDPLRITLARLSGPGAGAIGSLPVPAGMDVEYLRIAPDGGQVLYLAGTRLHRSGNGTTAEEDHKGVSSLEVDWGRDRVALGRETGAVELADLKTLKTTRTVLVDNDPIVGVAFTTDGTHLVVTSKARDAGEEHFLCDLAPDARPEVSGKAFESGPGERPGTIVADVSGDRLWWAKPDDAGLLLIRLDRTGRPESTPEWPVKVHATLRTSGIVAGGRMVDLIAVSEGRGLAVAVHSPGDEVFVFDLKSGLPLYRLLEPGNDPLHTVGRIAHLPPRLGSEPLFAEIEAESFHGEGTDDLLRLAAFVTRLRRRYDRVWFALLTAERSIRGPAGPEPRDVVGPETVVLCQALLALRQAEERLDRDKPAEALPVLQAALRSLRRPDAPPPAAPQPGPTTLEDLARAYRPVAERDLFLALGTCLERLGRPRDAEEAYRRVLVREPTDWRAYERLIELNLTADEPTFDALRSKAQAALRLHWLTESGPPVPTGVDAAPPGRRPGRRPRGRIDPNVFFDDDALNERRRIALEFRNSQQSRDDRKGGGRP